VPDSDLMLSFFLTALVLEITPGPNMVWLALLTATAGRKVGILAVAGVALGLALQGALAAVGVAALLTAWPDLYTALHLAGVGFLVWLAWQSWRDAGDPSHHQPGGGETGGEGFRSGLIANLLNPKAAVFFVTVLPGFMAEGAGLETAFVLSAIYLAVATAIHLAIVAAAGGLQTWLADPGISARMHQLQALALLAVAAWIFWRG